MPIDSDLHGRAALVTDASHGIGTAIAPAPTDAGVAIDNWRTLWAAEDIIRNRPALSRWHPDYAEAFARFMKAPR